MHHGVSNAKTKKVYIVAQVNSIDPKTLYIQILHYVMVNKNYGIGFPLPIKNQQFHNWLKKKVYKPYKSLNGIAKTKYARAYLRCKTKGLHVQIPGKPLNRKYGFAKTFPWSSIDNEIATKLRQSQAAKEKNKLKGKVYAIINFGKKMAVTCGKCQTGQGWVLGNHEGITYVQTYLPCYTCGKVLKFTPPPQIPKVILKK